MNAVRPSAPRSYWHLHTLVLLLVGYTGYYLCRSNFAVAGPLLLQDYALLRISHEDLLALTSFGILMYTVGKVVNGVLGDFVGGKVLFVLGMCVSVLATLYMSLALAFGTLLIGWGANRLAQSAGWGALTKLTAHWFSYPYYGRVMGVLSLSFLFGDSLVRLLLGYLVNEGMGWRGLMFASAAGLGCIAFISWWMLPATPEKKGLPPAEVNPLNVYRTRGDMTYPRSLRMLLAPYVRNPAFLLVLLMSVGLTAMRETIMQWSILYLTEVVRMPPGDAAQYSALFPFAGGVAGLLAGFVTDKFTQGRRGLYILVCMLLLVLVFLGLYAMADGVSTTLSVVALLLVGMLMMGPYTFLAGAMALDLGGKVGTSTAVGLIDGVGYLGSLVAGIGIGYLLSVSEWQNAFVALGGLSAFTAVVAALYWRLHEARSRKTD